MPPYYNPAVAANPVASGQLFNGFCSPSQRFFSAVPITEPGLAQIIPDVVTDYINEAPDVFLWEDGTFTPVAVGDDCAGGVTAPPLKKCSVVVQPYGKISVASEKYDLSTADQKPNDCQRALFAFQNGNGLPAGAPEALFAGITPGGDGADLAFVAAYQFWRMINRLAQLERLMAWTGNASVPSAFPNHWQDYNGMGVLATNDTTIYPCAADASFNKQYLSLQWAYSTSPTQNYLAASDATKKDFFLKLSKYMDCLRRRGRQFGVTQWGMYLPYGMIEEVADAITIGFNNAISTSTNTGSALMEQKMRIMETRTINVQGSQLTLIEDDTMPLLANFGTLDNTKKRGDMMIVPMNGPSDGIFIERLRWSAKADDRGPNGTWIVDDGRYKITSDKKGSCYQWFAATQPRLRMRYPFLTLRIRDVGFNAALCV